MVSQTVVGTRVSTREQWTYDGNGNPLSYLDPDGVLTRNRYDAFNRMTAQVVIRARSTINYRISTLRIIWEYLVIPLPMKGIAANANLG